MSQTILAIYENGVLRPEKPLEVSEGAKVEIIVVVSEKKVQKRTAAEVLAELAALPLEGEMDKFSGRDHDEVLYGKKQ